MKNENIKYTTDGRKVVIISDLNQTEKIVQEIFVTEDGAEIPSGERFVVKVGSYAPVFLLPHPDYPQVKDISMFKGREPEPLVECNGFCGLDDLKVYFQKKEKQQTILFNN